MENKLKRNWLVNKLFYEPSKQLHIITGITITIIIVFTCMIITSTNENLYSVWWCSIFVLLLLGTYYLWGRSHLSLIQSIEKFKQNADYCWDFTISEARREAYLALLEVRNNTIEKLKPALSIKMILIWIILLVPLYGMGILLILGNETNIGGPYLIVLSILILLILLFFIIEFIFAIFRYCFPVLDKIYVGRLGYYRRGTGYLLFNTATELLLSITLVVEAENTIVELIHAKDELVQIHGHMSHAIKIVKYCLLVPNRYTHDIEELIRATEILTRSNCIHLRQYSRDLEASGTGLVDDAIPK